MKAVTSPLNTWQSLVSRLALTPMLVFLLVSLPLTAVSVYVLPYFELALARFIWMVLILVVVLLTQIRASMEHPNNRFLNNLTSLPITFVGLTTFIAGEVAFSQYPPAFQSFTAIFLVVSTMYFGAFIYLRKHRDSALYRLLTRRGSTLVMLFVLFVLVEAAVLYLPNPAGSDRALPANQTPTDSGWNSYIVNADAGAAIGDHGLMKYGNQ